jgi:hypothetical protein
VTVWSRFESALGGALGALADDQFVVIRTRAGNRFVQFAGQGCAGLRAEAASNRVLEANERLDPAALDRLDALGYHRPTHDLRDDAEHDTGSCNHWFDYAVPVPYATVADQGVRALTEVFRVRHPNELTYSAFTDDGPPLLLPTLGLEVDRSPWPRWRALDRGLSVEDLRGRVLDELDATFADVTSDDDAVRVPFGSTVVFVRISGTPPVVQVWSPVVAGLQAHSRMLLEELSQRNLGARFVRFAVTDDLLVATHELFGDPFVPEHLVYAVSLIGDLATSIDAEFCDRFGGHTFFRNVDDDHDDS